jgi:multifunctional methyltransferase subunit TRM112
LPENIEESMLENETIIEQMHLVLLKRQVVEGAMKCPHCARVYEIKHGIPNMLLDETEV